MKTDAEEWRHAIVRAVMVAALVVAAGTSVLSTRVFEPRSTGFQFLVHGVTLAIAGAAVRSRMPRYGIVGLLFWWLVLAASQVTHTSYPYLLFALYVGAIGGAAYAIAAWPRANASLRIAGTALLVGAANELVMLTLRVVTSGVNSVARVPARTSFYSIGAGLAIGLVAAVALELADAMLARPRVIRPAAS